MQHINQTNRDWIFEEFPSYSLGNRLDSSEIYCPAPLGCVTVLFIYFLVLFYLFFGFVFFWFSQ